MSCSWLGFQQKLQQQPTKKEQLPRATHWLSNVKKRPRESWHHPPPDQSRSTQSPPRPGGVNPYGRVLAENAVKMSMDFYGRIKSGHITTTIQTISCWKGHTKKHDIVY